MAKTLQYSQARFFSKMVYRLWGEGADGAHEVYPMVSAAQFQAAGKYLDTLRCEGCSCGSCCEIDEKADNLDTVDDALKPLATAAQKLGEQEHAAQS